MTIKNVTIAGGGTLGSQVAWQTAYKGFNVILYDAFEKGIEASKNFHKGFADLFLNTLGVSQAEIDATFKRISYTTNLSEAMEDCDLINESIPEVVKIKKDFYANLAKVAPSKTIFTTNSSTTLPSDYAEFTVRPEKFLALHFANGIWVNNIGEVMAHPGTDPAIFDRVVEFAREIGMVPIPLHKEQNGYILNSLLMPLLKAGIDLLKNGISTIEDIDRTWLISTKAPHGPMGIIDIIGMETMYHIDTLWGEKLNDQNAIDRAKFIKENYIDKGHFGKKTGQGFYTYPNPSYQNPDFLKV
jgi:3-hydroxybutyryl-CoA dehydrogenase